MAYEAPRLSRGKSSALWLREWDGSRSITSLSSICPMAERWSGPENASWMSITPNGSTRKGTGLSWKSTGLGMRGLSRTLGWCSGGRSAPPLAGPLLRFGRRGTAASRRYRQVRGRCPKDGNAHVECASCGSDAYAPAVGAWPMAVEPSLGPTRTVCKWRRCRGATQQEDDRVRRPACPKVGAGRQRPDSQQARTQEPRARGGPHTTPRNHDRQTTNEKQTKQHTDQQPSTRQLRELELSCVQTEDGVSVRRGPFEDIGSRPVPCV